MRGVNMGLVYRIAAITIITAIPAAAPGASGADLNTAMIESAVGHKGKLNEAEKVFRIEVPRDDLKVMIGDVKAVPPMGIGSWVGFKKVGDSTMVMGDLALLEEQVNPTMSVVLDSGLEVTALHNHFAFDTPRIMYMHIGGMGDEKKLADAAGKVFTALGQAPADGSAPPKFNVDTSAGKIDSNSLGQILVAKGQSLPGGVVKFAFGLTVTMHGQQVGNAMGVNTWAAFAGSNERAAVDGDFVMTVPELQAVLKALRGAGINIVAIHNHMVEETPRTMFLHFWGVGPASDMAKAIKGALDAQKKASAER